jgi:protein-S-isoprenylcysteine O-methyltransferase Ste14
MLRTEKRARRSTTFPRAAAAVLVLPGSFAVLLPPVLAWLDPWRGRPWPLGSVVMAAGALVVAWCVRDFYVAGKGTLAPWDPPRRIVVVGLYRWVRNPMYVGVLLTVAGWSIRLASPLVAVYALALAAGFHRRVVRAEEPWLAREFGGEWTAYERAVGRWLPHR